jgi:endonuclease YncB( thermonuclease family)
VEKYKVAKIHDGDTITVQLKDEKYNIRLWGIDAPELNQSFGLEAKKFLENLIQDKEVEIDVVGIDVWGRKLGKVYLNGKSINENLVKNGMAWWNDYYYPKESNLEILEENARNNKVGLWKEDSPTSPWRWRKQVKIHQMETWLTDTKIRDLDTPTEKIRDIDFE